jgi:hypothetical protein
MQDCVEKQGSCVCHFGRLIIDTYGDRTVEREKEKEKEKEKGGA